MKLIRSLGPLALAAALLAACGGGDPYVPGSQSPTGGPTTPGSFTALVSFGDSLSDIGTYTPATAIPNTTPTAYFGGRFTTNLNDLGTLAATGKVWVENLATALSTATAPIIVTPAQVGFGTQSVDCPAAANRCPSRSSPTRRWPCSSAIARTTTSKRSRCTARS